MDILNYIDKMQVMYGDKEPSSMVPEPRSNYADGLKVDPVADSGRKLNEVIAAYERYRGGRKNPVINFNKFFEIYARENFATGGNVGGGADFSPQKIDDSFFIDHYRKVIDARLGAMEAVRKRGGSNNPNDVKYLFEQYNELKKHGGDVLEFDQRIRNLSPSAEEPEFAAQGGRIGQLVKPSGDGSRPGYMGEEGGEALKLKSLQADYDKFGKKKLNKAAKVLGFEDYASMSGQENSNFRRKIKRELDEYGEVLTRKESDIRGRNKRIAKEQKIQINLLKETNKNKFFDPKQFAKENKISMDYLKNQAERLQTNIYKKRMIESGAKTTDRLYWISNDPTVSDKTLNKLWKSKLIKYEREKIDELFYDAFGRQEIKGTNKKNLSYNPKKFLAVKANLNEYRQLRNAIKLKYPNINLALDHPLSKSSLKNLFNASADQLTRVNPLEFDLNNGFKDSLSQQYELSVKNKNPKQKKAVEKIAKDLKINIGKINKDATNFSYGVKEFQKLNMKDEIIKAIQNQADLSSNFKNYVKQNPELFKTANINPNVKITKITQAQAKGIAKKLEAADFKCKLANGLTCNDPRAYTQSIKETMAKVKQGDDAAIAKINKLGKSMKAFKGAAKATGWGLLTELGFVAPLAFVDYAKGANRDEIISNATYGAFGKSEEEQLKERYADYGKAQELEDTYNDLLKAENLAKTGAGYRTQAVNKLKAEELDKKLFEQSKLFNTILPPSMGFKGDLSLDRLYDAQLLDQQRRDDFAKEKELRSKELGILQPSTGLEAIQLAGGGIAGLSGGDPEGAMTKSMNLDSQGLRSLIKNGNKL